MHFVQAAELESVLTERTQHIGNAETTLKLKELEFERRATALETEHAAKMASVLQQMRVLQGESDRGSQQSELRQASGSQQSGGVPSAEVLSTEPLSAELSQLGGSMKEAQHGQQAQHAQQAQEGKCCID